MPRPAAAVGTGTRSCSLGREPSTARSQAVGDQGLAPSILRDRAAGTPAAASGTLLPNSFPQVSSGSLRFLESCFRPFFAVKWPNF